MKIRISEYKTTKKHPKCLGEYDPWSGDFGCGYRSKLMCDECAYGLGRKDPEAKRNHQK